MSASSSSTAHARSLYRSLLRELPPRPKNQPPTPLRHSIRTHFFSSPSQSSNTAAPAAEQTLARRQEAEQFVQYLKAQRMYGTLVDRYNPGNKLDEEERIRLTARRVGMDMPVEWYGDGSGSGKKDS